MSIDELARTYIAKIERQQRAQSTGLFASIRDRSERALISLRERGSNQRQKEEFTMRNAVCGWAIDLLRTPRFSYAIVASIRQSRDARSFDGVQLHLRPEFSPHACSARIRG